MGSAALIMYATEIATVITFTAAVAGSSAYARQQQRKARAAYNASLKDREITFRSGVAPRRVIYGRDRVGGTLAYLQSTGDKGEYLHLVIALAAHECDAIEEVWFGDVKLPDPDGSGFITSGDFAKVSTDARHSTVTTSAGGVATLPAAASRVLSITTPFVGSGIDATGGDLITGWAHTAGAATITGLPASASVVVDYEVEVAEPLVRIKKHLGGAGQVADADLVVESGGKWTSAHKGTGLCYLYLRLQFDPDVFASFDPSSITAVVRGRRVYDPRTSTTAWTENAALIAADWLRDQTFGLRAAAAEVPSAEVIAEANICDEAVTITGGGATQARYTINGSFTTDQAPVDVLEELLSGMAGTCIWIQGRWLLRAGAYRTPTVTLTADDLAGSSISVQPRTSRADLINAVRATHRDPTQAWAEVQAPLVANATYTAQDGGTQIARSIAMPGAMDSIRAQRLAKIELERARQAVSVRLTTSLRGYNLAPTDTATLQLSRYGWGSGKVFEVRERSLNTDGTITYLLRETAASVWAWALGEATVVDPAPDTELPSPYTPPAPLSGLAAASGTTHLLRMSDGTIVTRAYVTWDAVADAFVAAGGRIDLRWRRAGADVWQPAAPAGGADTAAFIAGVPDGETIIISARPVNAIGRAGSWTSIAHTVVGKTERPDDVASFTVVEQPGFGRSYFWDYRADTPDLAGFAVRYLDAALPPDWDAMVPLFEAGRLDRSRSAQVPADGEWVIGIKAHDTSGNQSASARYITVLLDQGGLGVPVASVDAGALGWPGTRTDCDQLGYYLADRGTLTWDTIPDTWDAWADWDGPSIGAIVYQHSTVDLGSSAARRLRAASVAAGVTVTEYQSSTDDVAYTSWAPIPTGTVTARYVRLRWTVTGAHPVLYRATFRIYT